MQRFLFEPSTFEPLLDAQLALMKECTTSDEVMRRSKRWCYCQVNRTRGGTPWSGTTKGGGTPWSVASNACTLIEILWHKKPDLLRNAVCLKNGTSAVVSACLRISMKLESVLYDSCTLYFGVQFDTLYTAINAAEKTVLKVIGDCSCCVLSPHTFLDEHHNALGLMLRNETSSAEQKTNDLQAAHLLCKRLIVNSPCVLRFTSHAIALAATIYTLQSAITSKLCHERAIEQTACICHALHDVVYPGTSANALRFVSLVSADHEKFLWASKYDTRKAKRAAESEDTSTTTATAATKKSHKRSPDSVLVVTTQIDLTSPPPPPKKQ